MSRSYHITKRQAVKRFRREGDSQEIIEFLEKRSVKKAVDLLRAGNPANLPEKAKRALSPRTAVRIAKDYMKHARDTKRKGNA
jgi:hypothetical protein